jgi:hypothetical protein
MRKPFFVSILLSLMLFTLFFLNVNIYTNALKNFLPDNNDLNQINDVDFNALRKIVLTIGEPTILIDDSIVEIDTDQKLNPFIENSRVLFPVKILADKFGAEVEWLHEEKRIDINLRGSHLRLWSDDYSAQVNYRELITLDVPLRIINNRAFLPAYFVAEFYGFITLWDNDNKKLTIFFVEDKSEEIKKNEQQERNNLIKRVLLENDYYTIDKNLLTNPKYRTQILYTHINRKEDDSIELTPYEINVDNRAYFYPASSIKLAMALLVLNKVNENNADIWSLVEFNNKKSDFLAHYIRKALRFSDNYAFDDLYDIVGNNYYHQLMSQRGYLSAKIFHRLGGGRPELLFPKYHLIRNNQVVFKDEERNEIFNVISNDFKDIYVGEKYVNKYNQYTNHPMSFAYRNSISISDLQKLLVQIFFPDYLSEKERFNLTSVDLDFIKEEMKLSRDKWFISGGKGYGSPDLEVYNKSGNAFGFLIDNAYIKDKKDNEFFLTATIYVNSNEILNDNLYDYDSIGILFFRQISYIMLDFTKTLNESW